MCLNVNCILNHKMVLFVASRVSKASVIYTHRDRSSGGEKKSAVNGGKWWLTRCDDARTHDSVLEEGVRKTSFFSPVQGDSVSVVLFSHTTTCTVVREVCRQQAEER